MLEIRKIQIKNIFADIRDSLPKEFQLKTACRVKVNPPKDQENKSLLLNVELEIMTVGIDDLKIELEANIIFELEQIPEDYAKFAEKECIPVAQGKLYDKIDEVLVIMGYSKMKLSEKMKDRM